MNTEPQSYPKGLDLSIAAGHRTMALDVGDARIGVALSDPTLLLASPDEIVERKAGGALEKIAAIVARESVDVVVAGLPVNMDGSVGKQAVRVRRFMEELAAKLPAGVSTCYWDERRSTVEAHAIRLSSGAGRQKRREHVDAVSAAIILQAWLDARRSRGEYSHLK